jgi:hypothetical protein
LLAIGGTCLAQAEPPRQLKPNQKIYLLQHRLIPEWTHRSNGAFFDDLSSGRHQRLLDLAAEVVSPEFAGGISIQTYPEADGLLITFPAPVEPPQCYFIYIFAGILRSGPSRFSRTKRLPTFSARAIREG